MTEKITEEGIEELRHRNKMEEIEAEKKARLEVIDAERDMEKTRFENQMSLHRLKRADIRRTMEAKNFQY